MTTVVQVFTVSKASLRKRIVADKANLAKYNLTVKKKLRPKKKGWAKLDSTIQERPGAINIEWLASARMLMCRIVTRGGNEPHLITGDLVSYLMGRYGPKISAIHIVRR